MRVLLDVHALLDLVSKNPSEADAIGRLKVMHEFKDVELWVSILSFAEFAAAVERIVEPDESKRLLEDSLSWLDVCSVDSHDVIAASAAGGMSGRERLEGVCAEKVGVDFIISRDGGSCGSARIPCGSVTDFIKYVERATNVRYAVVDLEP